MEPILSIIVPIYNTSKFMHKCIDSILMQSFTHFELILVDDGSKDDSGIICDEYATSDSRVKVIHKENGGVGSARKSGLMSAVGKYIGYVDGDDWIHSDMYKQLIHYIQKYDCDMVMCNVEFEKNTSRLFDSGGTNTSARGGYYNRQQLEDEVFPNMLYSGHFYKFGIYPVIWNKIYKREKLIKHQMPIDDKIRNGEDAACVYTYLLDCNSIYLIEDMSLYHYRTSSTQATVSYDPTHFESFKSLYDFFSKSELAKSPYANQLDYYYSFYIKISISNELKRTNKRSFKEKLKNIKNIINFALNCGFLDNIDTSSFPIFHRVYFGLIRKNKPFMLAVAIIVAKFIQTILK